MSDPNAKKWEGVHIRRKTLSALTTHIPTVHSGKSGKSISPSSLSSSFDTISGYPSPPVPFTRRIPSLSFSSSSPSDANQKSPSLSPHSMIVLQNKKKTSISGPVKPRKTLPIRKNVGPLKEHRRSSEISVPNLGYTSETRSVNTSVSVGTSSGGYSMDSIDTTLDDDISVETASESPFHPQYRLKRSNSCPDLRLYRPFITRDMMPEKIISSLHKVNRTSANLDPYKFAQSLRASASLPSLSPKSERTNPSVEVVDFMSPSLLRETLQRRKKKEKQKRKDRKQRRQDRKREKEIQRRREEDRSEYRKKKSF